MIPEHDQRDLGPALDLAEDGSYILSASADGSIKLLFIDWLLEEHQ